MRFHATSFVAGALAGGLAGAIAALIVANSRDAALHAALEAERRFRAEATRRATALLESAVEQFEAERHVVPDTTDPRDEDAPSSTERLAEDAAARREALARLGDPFAILDAMKKGESPDRELVADPEQFERLFARTSPEKPLIGDRLDPETAKTLPDGTRLTFGAGIFDLDLTAPLAQKPPPSDFAVVGAGIDNTLLVMEEISARGRLRNFAIRDCTVFIESRYMFDLRSDNDATLELDRVRVIGFDSGAGASCALGLHANALRARDCVFEGGYGRSPSHGTLLDVRTQAMLARFERCRFRQISVDLNGAYGGWRVIFDRCHFEDLLNWDPKLPPIHPEGVEFFGCEFSSFDRSRGDPPQNDLSRLFPDWPNRTGR